MWFFQERLGREEIWILFIKDRGKFEFCVRLFGVDNRWKNFFWNNEYDHALPTSIVNMRTEISYFKDFRKT